MAAITHDAKLNDLLIDLGRCLLQYAVEGCPWNRTPAVQTTLAELAGIQQQHVGRLTQFLNERAWPVDFGTYPTEFTDLHFVSAEYLLPRVIKGQSALVTELDEAIHTCIADPPAIALLRDVLAGEQQVLERLKQLQPQISPATR